MCEFEINQKTESFFKGQPGVLGILHLFFQPLTEGADFQLG